MKAFAAVMAASLLAFTSCGNGRSSSGVDITGTWRVNDEGFTGGYVFGSDGTADIYVCPDNIYFLGGDLFIAGIHIGSSDLSYDGNILRAEILGEEAVVLDRTGEAVPDSYEGDYILTGGSLRENIAHGMGITDAGSAELHFTVNSSSIRITAADAVDYSIDGSTLSFKGHNGFPDSSGEFELSGNTLSVTRTDGTKRVLVKES